ncbi:asparaginase [Niveibacterium sp. SC-1]|uniref:asparaginase n=1 Tax=Niveibacterium sp. SC-1 TaxID=3135646 RepID=UPI00311DFCEA
MAALPRITLVATGGTIAGLAPAGAGAFEYQAGALAAEALLQALPQAGELARLGSETLFSLDSKDLEPTHWLRLIARLRDLLAQPEVDGIVVTHGTDTLEETACALDLCLPRGKPVILTAAMRPASAPGADGPLNLLQAIRAAATPELGACGPLVAAGDRLWRARDIGKRHTHAVDALGAFAEGPLGLFRGTALHLGASPTAAAALFSDALPERLPWVDILPGYAGAAPSLIDAAVADGAEGLVLALAGHGSVPERWLPALARAAARVPVVRASRIPAGGVWPQANFDDAAHGLIAAGSRSAWQARVLLSFGLARGLGKDALAGLFAT